MATTNPITGDLIKSKATTETFRSNYDLIFGKKNSSADNVSEDKQPKENENGNDGIETTAS